MRRREKTSAERVLCLVEKKNGEGRHLEPHTPCGSEVHVTGGRPLPGVCARFYVCSKGVLKKATGTNLFTRKCLGYVDMGGAAEMLT